MAKVVKIVLGKRPESFAREVTFPMLDGSIGGMEIKYKYRSRKEFAAFADEFQSLLKTTAEDRLKRLSQATEAGEELPDLTQAELLQHEASFRVDYIMDAVSGWNLDVPFGRAAVEQLVDELPAAATAVIAAYREAIIEGRVGN